MIENIPPPTPREDLNVLIIDNQGLVHEVVTAALHELGMYNISSTFNAFHAIRLCEQQRFDLVLLAFNVSHDKDGFHLFEELKHLGHINDKSTVIFLSAETTPELVNCIVELQPDDFWVKPLDKQRVKKRLNYLFSSRQKLNKMLHCMHIHDYSTAMYYAERQLNDMELVDYHPRIKRLIGDCLLNLRDYSRAESYFRSLLESLDYAWIHIGLAKSLLRQDELEKARALVEDLLARHDTRFLTYDLLAQYYIEKEMFDQAYEQMKQASKLAPRNINRNKKLWDLARLNHDKVGQLAAVQNMARFARNSIHDSPELKLNVIRSTIDVATSLGGEESERYLRKALSDTQDLRGQKGAAKQLDSQLKVLEVRMLCLKNDKKDAQKIMEDMGSHDDGLTMEDNLDKMKAYHELGMREHCISILDKLRKQIAGDNFTSQMVNEYLKQESLERVEVQFTTKELKQMATANYKENRFVPAFNNLHQAFIISPQDKQIAMSLLKILVQLQKVEALTDAQFDVATEAAHMLLTMQLPPSQALKRDTYVESLGVSTQLPEKHLLVETNKPA